jgi:spermidine/putrescine transport system substrate-binding protein
MNWEIAQKRCNRRQFVAGTAGFVVGAAALSSGLAACGSSSEEPAATTSVIEPTPDGDLQFFAWSEYIDPDLVTKFEDEYGVKINQTFYDSDEAMAQKVASGAPYDVVMTNSAYIGPLSEAGYLTPLNQQMSNWGQLIDAFKDPFYDPGAKYSIPYGYSPCGLGWRTDKVDSSLFTGSWNDMWDLAPKADKKLFVFDIVGYAMGASLARLGYNINSGDANEVDQAAQELIKLKPMMAGFSTDDRGKLSSGEAWISQAWPGDIYRIMQEAKDPSIYGYETCKESAIMGSDLLSVAKAAASPGTAMLFINFMMDPENSAKNVQYTGYPNGTKGGEAAYATMIADYPSLTVSEDALSGENAWKLAPTGERLALWNKAWREVQSA